MGVFESENQAVREYMARAAELGRPDVCFSHNCDSHYNTSLSKDSTESTGDTPSVTQVKISLGRTIRDLAEANHQLARALTADGDQDLLLAEELTLQIQRLLRAQDQCVEDLHCTL